MFESKKKLNELGYTQIIIPQEKPRSAGEVLGCTSPKLEYIEDSKIASDEHKKVFYQGTIDRISNVIVGVIQGKDMDGIIRLSSKHCNMHACMH